MHRLLLALLSLFSLLSPGVQAAAAPILHHRLELVLTPGSHQLSATDTVTLPAGHRGPVSFDLLAGLHPAVESPGALTIIGRGNEPVPFIRYRLDPGDTRRFILKYQGAIDQPLAGFGEGVGHRREVTTGLIAADGVFLDGASAWYPEFVGVAYQTFDLSVQLPSGWQAVSQGRQVAENHWQASHPQQEITLVAAPFTRYSRPGGPAKALVYLRRPDPQLAERYLAVTGAYLKLFSGLMGPYPYSKFALVENFWETGLGLPSYTLLGPQVIRLPFILDSSYPHEIVHNWWGNGVYVDYAHGNWSEGLTAYMADHLLKEREGRGAEYRRDQLEKYARFVTAGRDFPLSEFTERHSGASQAIGYGKGLMFFHMLRLRLGDQTFLNGLRRFYREYRFKAAGFADLRGAFEAESGQSLGTMFSQWVQRPGAPTLALAAADFGRDRVSLRLEQSSSGAPWRLDVPVSIGLADGRLVERSVPMDASEAKVELKVPGRSVCVAVDPRYDLFRRLLPGELPPSLDALFGSKQLLLVVPAEAPAPLRAAYRRLAEAWAAGNPGVSVRRDDQLEALPTDRPVWIFGWRNRFRAAVEAALPAVHLQPDGAQVAGRSWPRKDNAFVLAGQSRGQPLAWLATDDPVAVEPLARKVPHYGKYGYLVFTRAAADNQAKGQWAVMDSPLMRRVGAGACIPGPRPPLARLAAGNGPSPATQ